VESAGGFKKWEATTVPSGVLWPRRRETQDLTPENRLDLSGKSVVMPFSLAADPARLAGRPTVCAIPVSGDLPGRPRQRGGVPFGRRPVPTLLMEVTPDAEGAQNDGASIHPPTKEQR
jgi:hypothetical protein